MNKSTAVVILNYNGEAFLKKFLPDVIEHSRNVADVYVADNASTDQSLALLASSFPEVKIIRLNKNEGYAGGYNNALSKIEAKYYILLNSDVKVTPNWIEPIVSLMEQHSSVAACQPKILSYNDPDYFEYAGAAGGFIDWLGYPFCRGRIFETLEKDNGQYNDECEIFWASGACMFVRSEIFHKMNGFDSSFFAHMEEIDLCWRIKNAGYKIYYSPSSTIYHVGGGTLQKSNPKKTYLNFRNNLRMLWRNLSFPSFALVLSIRYLLDFAVILKNILTFQFGNSLAVVRAHLALYPFIMKTNRLAKSATPFSAMKGTYSGSLVCAYYLQGKRFFSSLNL